MTTPRYTRAQLFENRTYKTVRRPGVGAELVNAAEIDLFTITGSPIICSIFGVITGTFEAAATTLQLMHSVTDQDLGAACTTLSGQVAGIHLNPTGGVAVAMAIGAGTSVGVHQPTNKWSLSVGNIYLLVGGATSTDGVVDWYITYLPMLSTGLVVAA